MTKNDPSPDTLLAQGGHFIDSETRAIVAPIHPSTTFGRDARYETRGFVYTRTANPTGRYVEALLARLEGAEDALLFASGMAGIATFFETLRRGERVIAPRVMYHGSADWLRRLAERQAVALGENQPLKLDFEGDHLVDSGAALVAVVTVRAAVVVGLVQLHSRVDLGAVEAFGGERIVREVHGTPARRA